VAANGERESLRNRPIQIVHSFEGLANALDGIEVMPTFGRPRPFDTERFEERVRAELGRLAARGIGGIAVNVGYDRYLENEEGWRRFIRGVELAVELGFRIWIYDENGFPSGSAGGLSLRGHPELEALGIKRMRVGPVAGPCRLALPHPRACALAAYGQSSDGRRTRLDVEKDAAEICLDGGSFDAVDLYFIAPNFEGTHADYRDTSRKPFINPLDRRAVSRFLSVTHLEYFRRLPPHLWRRVQAVFTDEPSLMAHVLRPDPAKRFYPCLPWSEELSARFCERHGYFIEEGVESLFGGDAPEDRKRRRDFWSVAAGLYEQALGGVSGEVCAAIRVGLSGHLLAEESLWQHAVMQGNALGVLQHFHIPGIDVLTCDPELVNRSYSFTIKTGLSAAVLGGKRGLMVEVSEYGEYWTPERRRRLQEVREYWAGPRNANPPEYLKYTLAYCFLAGVREFAFYFPWRAFSEAEYRELCDFVRRLNDLGRGAPYKPTCALYYPIETIWEEYVPSEKDIWTGALEGQSERCRTLNRVMSDTCENLLLSNIQFIFADRRSLPKLRELGIRTLLFPQGETPSPEAQSLCRRMGIEPIELFATDAGALTARQRADLSHPALEAGRNVIYHSYDGFIFILNTGKQASSFDAAGTFDAVFPQRSLARQKIRGNTSLGPLECAFVYATPAPSGT